MGNSHPFVNYSLAMAILSAIAAAAEAFTFKYFDQAMITFSYLAVFLAVVASIIVPKRWWGAKKIDKVKDSSVYKKIMTSRVLAGLSTAVGLVGIIAYYHRNGIWS
jgi:hypothetical protein